MLINLLDDQYEELDIIKFPFGTLSLPPVKLKTAKKYLNLLQQIGTKKKNLTKDDEKIINKLLNGLLEWLNTNVENIKVTEELLEDNLTQKQLNALVIAFGESIANIEKK